MTSTLKIVSALGDTGKTLTLSLPDPKDGLTLASVGAAMDKAYENDLLVVNGTAASALKKAYIHRVEDVDING